MSFYQFSENDLKNRLESLTPPYVFLETSSFNKENNSSFLFNNFKDVIVFNPQDNVNLFFNKIEKYLDKGYWLCGYFTYEFGYCLDPALYHLRKKGDGPLAWLGVCSKPIKIAHDNNSNYSKKTNKRFREDYKVNKIKAGLNFKEYSKSLRVIKDYLQEGFTYQVNFTFKIKFNFSGSVIDFYLDLRRQQPTFYTALISTGADCMLSFSPELFFRSKSRKITAQPMKGTTRKGFYPEYDKLLCQEMRDSLKIKAENLMIVDLLRNDLGRIANKIKVPKLFHIERYKTLHQMTSTIEANINRKLQIRNIFSALFPCGSVTGAPKIKTMEIIHSLEKEARGVYTGSIGYISPSRKMCFNVAIRTINIHKRQGQLGVGGGIVYDSSSKEEYKEALLKAKFFTSNNRRIQLIETILLEEPAGYFLLDFHLNRLMKSANYFSIPLHIRALKEKLDCLLCKMEGKFKIRVIVNFDGNVKITRIPLGKVITLAKVKLSSRRVNPENCFLYHKTNRRTLYDQERKKAKQQGYFDVIFMNIHKELTEGAISNLFISKKKCLWTPHVKSGLLPGVLRKHLIKEGKAKEKLIKMEDLLAADEVYVGNSVRGLIKAKVANTSLKGNK